MKCKHNAFLTTFYRSECVCLEIYQTNALCHFIFFLTVVKCISSLIPDLDLDVVTIYGRQRREMGEPNFVPYRHCCLGISTLGTPIDGVDFYMNLPIKNNTISKDIAHVIMPQHQCLII